MIDLGKLSAEIKREEGLRLFPYLDTAGKISIGYGRNLSDKGITAIQAEWLLHDDLIDVLSELDAWFPWHRDLNEVRQRALADLCFNMGPKTLSGFHHMIAALQAEDYDLAANEALDSQWAKQVGPTRSTRIADMLRTGQDTQP